MREVGRKEGEGEREERGREGGREGGRERERRKRERKEEMDREKERGIKYSREEREGEGQKKGRGRELQLTRCSSGGILNCFRNLFSTSLNFNWSMSSSEVSSTYNTGHVTITGTHM